MAKLSIRMTLLLMLPPLLWASNAVVGRLAVGSIPPIALNALRWIFASLLLLPLGWRVIATPAARAQISSRWRELSLLSFLGVGCYNSLQYLALTTSTPLNVTLIAASSPLWMMSIGALFYRVRPHGREWAGAAASLAGVWVVLTRGQATALAQVRFVSGDFLMLLAVMCWAFYSWLLARPPVSLRNAARPQWNWAEFLLIQTMFGSMFGSVAAFLEHGLTAAPVQWSWWVWLVLVYVAVGPSIIAYRCWGRGVAAVGPSVAALFSNLTPLFAALLSAALLGEGPQAYHGLAFLLILVGIGVSFRR